METLIVGVALWLLFAGVAAGVAAGQPPVTTADGTEQRHSAWFAFFIGLFFGPFGWLIVGAYVATTMPDGTPKVKIVR